MRPVLLTIAGILFAIGVIGCGHILLTGGGLIGALLYLFGFCCIAALFLPAV